MPDKISQINIIYYGDADKAKIVAKKIRDRGDTAFLRDALAFNGDDIEKCHQVLVMADVSKDRADLISITYGDKVKKEPAKKAQAPSDNGGE